LLQTAVDGTCEVVIDGKTGLTVFLPAIAVALAARYFPDAQRA